MIPNVKYFPLLIFFQINCVSNDGINLNNRYFRLKLVHSLCCCFSNGPQKCGACIKEDIFEDPTSILKQGCVSILDNVISIIRVTPIQWHPCIMPMHM